MGSKLWAVAVGSGLSVVSRHRLGVDDIAYFCPLPTAHRPLTLLDNSKAYSGIDKLSVHWMENLMCRNIKTLHNFKPPATEEEIRASSLQFVRKLSGFTKPSKANEVAFNRAVEQVAEAANLLLASLVTNAPPRDRAVEAAKARARSAERFGDTATPTSG